MAGIGVFNGAWLAVRERAADIAILKALGLTANGTMAMTASSALVLVAVAAAAGVPSGILLLQFGAAQLRDLYGLDLQPVLNPLSGLLIVLGALVVAVAGSWFPARWAARTPVTAVLRAE